MRRSLLLCAFLCLLIAVVAFLCLRGRKNTPDSSLGGVVVSGESGTSSVEETAVLEEAETPQDEEKAVPVERLSLSGRERGPFTVLSSTPQETLLEFQLPEYSLEEVSDEEGVLHSRVELPGSINRNALGAPQAPYYVVPYGTLPDAQVSVDLQDAEYDFVEAEAPLAGTGPTWASDGRSVSEPQPMELANQETLWRSESYQLRGIQGVNVSLSPFLYDEEAGGYRVLTRGVVRIRSSATQEPEVDSQSDLATMQRHFFRNGDSFRSADRESVGVLAVVVPDAWKEDETLARYVAWKKSLGWEVIVGAYPGDTGGGAKVTTETTETGEIIETTEEADPEEARDAIKSWIQTRYDQDGITHLLLLGDSAQIPPYQHCYVSSSAETQTSDKIYTDQPYSLLAGKKDEVYGDVLWGRIPVDSQSALDARLTGYLEYERGDAREDDSWTRSILCLGSASASQVWPYEGKMDQEIVEAQRQKLADAGIVTGGTLFWDTSENSPLKCPARVKQALEDGAGTFLYLGHGGCVGLLTTNFTTYSYYWDSENGKYVFCGPLYLSMGTRVPFWMTPVCDIANLDHGRAGYGDASCGNKSSKYSFGQSLFQISAEGLAASFAVMGDCPTYWEPPIAQMEAYSDVLSKSRGSERLATQGAYAMDPLWEAVLFCENYSTNYWKAHTNYEDDFGGYVSDDAVYHVRSINFLGDPTAVVRQGLQSALSVQCALRSGGMTVTVSGLPESAEGATKTVRGAVAALESEGVLDACRTDAQGQAVLALSPYEASDDSESEPLSITLRVLDGSGPYVEQQIPWLDKDSDGTVSIQEYLDWQFLWHDAYPGDEASSEVAQSLQTQARALRQQFPATETIEGTRGQLWTLDWSDSLTSTLAGAGIPLVARDAEAGTLQVRLNQEECVWLIEQDVYPTVHESAVVATPSRTVADLRQRLSELSKNGWPCFQLSNAGGDEAGTKLPVLRVAFGEEEDSADRVRPQILFLAGLSGDEEHAVEGLMAFLEECWSARGSGDGDLADALRQCVLWVAPVWNPSGYDQGLPENSAGVELDWGFPRDAKTLSDGASANLDGTWSYPSFQGDQAASPQPEQSVLVRWLARCQPDLVLSLHQGDSCVAFGGDTAQALSKAWKASDDAVPVLWDSQSRYPASGRFLEWCDAWLECPALELYLPKANCESNAPARLTSLLKTFLGQGRGGVVRDSSTNEPIPYAQVSNGASKCTDRADSRGRYFLPLGTEGDCLFQAEGYASSTSDALSADSSAGTVCWMAPQENRLLPGVSQERVFQMRNLAAGDTLRLEAPEGWTLVTMSEEEEESDAASASNVLESSWTEAQESALLTVRITPPDGDDSAEFVLKGSISDSPGSVSWEGQWALPIPPKETLSLELPGGWSAISVPLEGISASALDGVVLYRWKDDAFVRVKDDELLLPGCGYFACAKNASTLELSGAVPLEVRLSLTPGWHFLGVVGEHLPESSEPQFTVRKGVYSQQDSESPLAPGAVRMLYLEKAAVVFP